MQFQYFNLNNSNKRDSARTNQTKMSRAIPAIVAIFSMIILVDSSQLPSALSGRLHPAATPGAFALVTLAIALVLLMRRQRNVDATDCEAVPAVPARTIVAAVAAIMVLAFGVRALGVVMAVSCAGFLVAAGVAGAGALRAGAIGVGLGVACGIVFVWALRQPLPLWPSFLAM